MWQHGVAHDERSDHHVFYLMIDQLSFPNPQAGEPVVIDRLALFLRRSATGTADILSAHWSSRRAAEDAEVLPEDADCWATFCHRVHRELRVFLLGRCGGERYSVVKACLGAGSQPMAPVRHLGRKQQIGAGSDGKKTRMALARF